MTKQSTIIFVIISLVVLGLRIFTVFFLPNVFDNTLKPNFSDLVNSLGTLFSGLAFLGFIYTAYLQQQELGLQREELRLTREELQKSAEAQQGSAKSLHTTAKLSALTAKPNYYGNIEIAGKDYQNTFDPRVAIPAYWGDKGKKISEDVLAEINLIISNE